MKITVFQDEQKSKAEKEVCLRLVESNDRAVLRVVDPHTGNWSQGGALMVIGEDGIFRLSRAVSPKIGFPLEGAPAGTVVVKVG